MKNYVNPPKEFWEKMCNRPSISKEELTQTVNEILVNVKQFGDQALMNYSRIFDDIELSSFEVTQRELEQSADQLSEELKDAIRQAKDNIFKFHNAQQEKISFIETTEGVVCWRKSIAIDKVGLYIPGGSAPLFSTILMLGIPAVIAGCKEIVLCTPPSKDGTVHPAILFTAQLVGIKKIYKVGGAQAIAAMAYGTEIIPEVYKIFGPGNQYVTKAKELIQQTGVAIDMPAGPSEVLIIADNTCVPAFVAADLLSQAEHGADSQVVLLSNDELVLNEIKEELAVQLSKLPRVELATKALENSFSILFDSMDDCFQFCNNYAPEHLIIASENAAECIDLVVNAGSVFIGNNSCESIGDYAGGTNHTLPTNGYARNYSGVSLDSFVRKITFQRVSEQGIQNIGPTVELMAEAEELFAHKNAVSIRLNYLKNA